MKKAVLLLITTALLLSMKDKPLVKVNPDFLGSYYPADTAKSKNWVLKQHPDAVNKIDFYHGTEADPTFTVVMKDSTHFKTPYEFAHTASQVTTYWTAKGVFIDNHQMEIAIQTSNVSAGLKISFSMEEAEKLLFQKR